MHVHKETINEILNQKVMDKKSTKLWQSDFVWNNCINIRFSIISSIDLYPVEVNIMEHDWEDTSDKKGWEPVG